MLKKNLLSLALAMTILPLAACSNNETVQDEPVADVATDTAVVDAVEPEATTETMPEADPMVETTATQNIAELAASNPDLSTLAAALKAAELDQTLMAPGSTYTVFAPTNEAFAALLTTLGVTQEELLADKELLTSVLTYHVVPDAAVMAADIPYGNDITTVNGKAFTISDANVITAANGGTANITQPDVMATNGVVHVIDAVLLPQ